MFDRLRRHLARRQVPDPVRAAVVLIIAAALAVPWHRMEQLTQQLDERSWPRQQWRTRLSRHIAVHSAGRRGAAMSPPPRRPPPRRRRHRRPPPPRPPTGPPPTRSPACSPAARAPHHAVRARTLAGFIAGPTGTRSRQYYERRTARKLYRFAQRAVPDRAMRRPATRSTTTSSATTLRADRRVAADDRRRHPPHRRRRRRRRRRCGDGLERAARRASGGRSWGSSASTCRRHRPDQLLLNRFFILSARAAGRHAGDRRVLPDHDAADPPAGPRAPRDRRARVSGDLNVRSDINTGDEFQRSRTRSTSCW